MPVMQICQLDKVYNTPNCVETLLKLRSLFDSYNDYCLHLHQLLSPFRASVANLEAILFAAALLVGVHARRSELSA